MGLYDSWNDNKKNEFKCLFCFCLVEIDGLIMIYCVLKLYSKLVSYDCKIIDRCLIFWFRGGVEKLLFFFDLW